MPIVADAAVAIRGDMSGFKKDLGGAEKQTQTLGEKMKGALSPKNLLLAGGGLLAGAQLTGFFKDAIGAAAEFNDSVGATGVIFGESAIPAMEEWANKAHENFGASKQDALAAANSIAVLGKSAGKSGADLVDFSQEMVQLGGDLASMFGGSTEQAIAAVGAALRGESEPIRRYGVLLSDAVLRQKAFEMGLISTTNEALNPQAKVLAAHASILEQTTDAQGDFVRTSDGMANSQRALEAQMQNVTIEVGQKLLPAALAFVTFLNDVGIPVLREVFDGLDMIADGVGWLADRFIGARAEIAGFASGFGEMGDRVTELAERTGTDVGTMRDQIVARMKETGETWEQAFTAIEEQTTTSMTQVNNAVAANMGGVKQVVVDRGAEIRAEWEKTSRFIPQAIRDRWAETRDAAFQITVQHAKGILDGQNQVKVAFEVLTQLQDEEQTRAQRISYLRGKLSSQQLRDGLNDGRPGVRGAAQALRGQIVAELAGLGVNAYSYGRNAGQSLADGLWAKYGVVRTAAGGLAGAIEGQIGIRSEPKAHDSPLRGITRFGGNIVETMAEGIYGQLSTGRAAAHALAGALVPAVGVPALAGAGSGVGAGGVTNQWILNAGGVEKVFHSRDDFMQALDDLGSFGEGRL